jgi:hypothetical protein
MVKRPNYGFWCSVPFLLSIWKIIASSPRIWSMHQWFLNLCMASWFLVPKPQKKTKSLFELNQLSNRRSIILWRWLWYQLLVLNIKHRLLHKII